jgi:hypothetical protein
MKKMWYLCTMELYSAIKKTEILSFQVNGWSWRTSSEVKLARFRKPKTSCFLSYLRHRSNTNKSKSMKNRSLKGEVTNMRGRVKEGG